MAQICAKSSYSSTSSPVSAARLTALSAQRLDVVGRRHDRGLLAAHDAYEVLELHLVRKCRVNGGLLDVGGLDHEAREREQARGKPEGG